VSKKLKKALAVLGKAYAVHRESTFKTHNQPFLTRHHFNKNTKPYTNEKAVRPA
jgi:hypothetical protein